MVADNLQSVVVNGRLQTRQQQQAAPATATTTSLPCVSHPSSLPYLLPPPAGGPSVINPLIFENATYNLTVLNATNATTPVNGQSKYYGPVPSPLPPGVTYITLRDQWEPASNMTATCNRLVGSLSAWSAQQLRRIQNFTLDWRAGDGSRTGGCGWKGGDRGKRGRIMHERRVHGAHSACAASRTSRLTGVRVMAPGQVGVGAE